MKKLIPAYILSFIIAFMLYIVEPISMFVNNRNDFNFNFSNFIKPMLLIFFVIFIGLSLFYTIIYFINKKFSNKLGFYNVILIISYIGFILLYIQGNYMTSNLPKLDGSTIDWSIYGKENIIFFVILAIVVITYVICCKKYKMEKVINISKNISLAIFAMVFVGFIPSLLSGELYSNKKVLFVSNNNINNISTNKNFVILLLDTIDSSSFKEVVDNSEYKDLFNDFTYYPDTLSMYPFTRDAIPQILSGKTNYNETSFVDYYNTAMDSSPLIEKLSENGYDINLYEHDIKWNTEKSKIVSNIYEYTGSFTNKCYAKQETKYVLFKYLPYFLKQYSKIDYFSMNSCKDDYVDNSFTVDNIKFNNIITSNELNKVEQNYFEFVHLEGAHSPFDNDKDLNKIEDGTYTQKLEASLTIAKNFITRLKESGTYDNSIIIIMADHGYGVDDWQSRLNPVLYIKGFNEHQNGNISNKAVSYADLMDAFIELLDGKKSTEIFSNVSNDRERPFIWYLYLEEDHMEEMVAAGKAWDFGQMKKTGQEYDR